MAYNEIKQHGREDFPFQLYKIDYNHPRYEMVCHWHASVELIKIVSGTLLLTLNGTAYTAKEGDYFFVNSETLHGAIPQNCRYECLVFSLAFLKSGNLFCDQFLDDLLLKQITVCEKIEHFAVISVIEKLFAAMNRPEEGYQFLTIGAANELFAQIYLNGLYHAKTAEASEKDAKATSKLKKTLAFMRKNYDSPLTIAEIAHVSGFSVKYFCSFFKKETGKTPFGYLVEYRIEKAAAKLLSTDLEITTIAYSCGFNDLSYFIKCFKKIKGVSPKAYRKAADRL